MGLSVLRFAGGAVHGSASHAGAAVARRSSANPRAACARLLHSIRERERDRHQSERCGYPFGAADPASRRRGVITPMAINKKKALRQELAEKITPPLPQLSKHTSKRNFKRPFSAQENLTATPFTRAT